MFRFKQFTIRQDRSPMKVGTDGVLLGAWVGIPPATERILDIGTGTGLIALMLAQRTAGPCASAAPDAGGSVRGAAGMRAETAGNPSDAAGNMLEVSGNGAEAIGNVVDATGNIVEVVRNDVEAAGNTADAVGNGAEASARRGGVRIVGIDVADVSQARENGDASPWRDRVTFVQCAVQEYRPAERFSLIVSNPPFFVDSLTCPDAGRTTARHAVTLPYGELCDAVVRLLAPGGRFAVVLPTAEAGRFLDVCRGRLTQCRRTDVRTTPRRPPKRALMEFALAADRESTATGPASPLAGSASPLVGPASPLVGLASPLADPASPHAGPATAAAPLDVRSAPPAAVPASSVAKPASSVAVPFAASSVPPDNLPEHPAAASEEPQRSELVIGTGQHECYTEEYRALTGDFYLKF